MLHARFLSTSVDCLLSAGNSVKPLDRTSLVHIPPLSMRVNQKLVEDVQAAFDEATTAYKTQVGDGAAWSEFYDCLTEILDRSTGLLGMRRQKTESWESPKLPSEEAFDKQLSNMASDLRDVAKDPELLVRSSASPSVRSAVHVVDLRLGACRMWC